MVSSCVGCMWLHHGANFSSQVHNWCSQFTFSSAGLVGYVLADLGSGIYHWGIDNYGSALTPIVGAQIEAFQGHHKLPWTITRRQFANNLHVVARVVTSMVLPIDVVCDDPIVLRFHYVLPTIS
ncbi:hypothetical protein CerSpe_158020 [Prunus speciosa]